MIGITVLGSTGSIGISTLDVISRHPGGFRVVGLTANRDVAAIHRQCLDHNPEYAVMADAEAAEELHRLLRRDRPDVRVLSGVDGLQTVSTLPQVRFVMAAIVGAAGLLPTLAAARAGKRILLANKEALVMSGALFMEESRANNAELLPIDSEHNAIFQCMPPTSNSGIRPKGVRRILLTASGGPFRDKSVSELHRVTPEEACRHPNWAMGQKVSIDSATMMNKGLEVIEACWLFGLPPADIEVVVHRQSVIHSMVEYVDGSVLAQLGNPDMRTPIAHGLAWPQRIESGVKPLDIFAIAHLDFERTDTQRFPCLALAYEAIEAGGTAAAILNAANEVAVQAFAERRIPFTGIPAVIEKTLAAVPVHEAASLGAILEDDAVARAFARECVASEPAHVAL